MADPRNGYPMFQQAYFVNDVEAHAKKWSELYGAGPFRIAAHHKTDSFEYRGQPIEADVSYAFGYLGDIMIQFIQQHDEKASIYRDMYKRGEEGFHHVAFLARDFEGEFKRLQEMGFDCACRLHADNVDAAYFDTRSVNGCFTELHGDPPQAMRERWTALKRSHELWKPGDHWLVDIR